MNHDKPLPETGLIRIDDVLRHINVGKSTWWAGVKTGRFPKPIKLPPRITVWRVEDIRAFIANASHNLNN